MAVSPIGSRGPHTPPVSFPKRAGLHASKHYFQPPETPVSTAGTPSSEETRHRSRAPIASVNGSRKRTRPGPSPVQELGTPWSMSSNWTNVDSAASIARSDAMSPMPFVNTTYIFEGGMETPSQEIETTRFDNDIGDKDFRRRWNTNEDGQNGASAPVTANGTPRSGWGSLVYNLAGAVAGKMWNFCTSAPFRGFYAGGGEGVALDPNYHSSLQQASSMWENLESTRTMTPIPGQYPMEDPFTAQADTTPPRPTKKMHTDSGASWILVPPRGFGDLDTTTSRCSSPARLSHRKTPSQSYIPRPSLQRQPSQTQQPLQRRSLIPLSRRSSLAATQSPSNRPASRQSFNPAQENISPRSRNYTPSNPFASYCDRPSTPMQPMRNGNTSPLSPEAQQYADRMREEDEMADESMRNMNERLMDLIRQGQMALESKPGHDTDMYDDEGFQDGHF